MSDTWEHVFLFENISHHGSFQDSPAPDGWMVGVMIKVMDDMIYRSSSMIKPLSWYDHSSYIAFLFESWYDHSSYIRFLLCMSYLIAL